MRRSGFVFEVRWWSQWWLLRFPVLALRRLRCKHPVRYDQTWCLDCGAPWFRETQRQSVPLPPLEEQP